MAFYINLAENILSKSMDSAVLARLYNAKGNLCRYYEKNDKSLEYFFKSLSINKRIGNKKEQINNLGNIGQIYILTSDYSSALKNAFELLRLSREINFAQGEMLALKDIAYINYCMDSLDTSIAYYNLSLASAKKINDKLGESYTHLGIGEVLIKKKEYKNAVISLSKAYDFYYQSNVKYLLMIASQKLGDAYTKLGKHSKAINHFLKSAEIAKELNIKMKLKILIMVLQRVIII